MDNIKGASLREIIDEKGIRKKHIAEVLGIPYPTFLKRLDHTATFSLDNIYEIKNLLNLSREDCVRIFFPDASEKAKKFFLN